MKKETFSCTPKAREIAPFYVMELLEKAKLMEAGGEDIVHMEIGEPDFTTPDVVKRAALRAIKEDRTFYTESLGIPELRQRVADEYRRKWEATVSAERVVITNGTSGAFLLLSAVLLGSGRNLVISDPGYPCYRNFGRLANARTLSLPVDKSSRFELMASQIDGLKGTPHLTIVANPSNPTGIVYREGSIARLNEAVRARKGLLVVDEIYSGLTYGATFKTALALSDEVIVVNGFSKTFAMTGWRLGWMVVPPSLVRPIQKVAQNIFISPPTVSQYAALAAFEAVDDLKRMKETYRQRRDFLLPQLRRLGFTVPVDPEGAFYIYTDIGRWGMDSMTFVERALREARVALTPGYDFGSHLAGSHIRFSYANSMERLQEGCKRLEAWLKSLGS